MSDVDKDEFKREYLPLVNTNSEGKDMNPQVNHHKSVISDIRDENKYSVVKGGDDAEEGFFKKNKKVILIALGVLLGLGIITGIILAIVLKGGDGPGPHPDPDRPQPDPFQYQEFNPFYIDEANPPKVTTFEANFNLKFNYSAFPVDPNTTNGTNVTDGRRLHQMSQSLRNFLGEHQLFEEHVNDQNGTIDGTKYRPMNPRYLANSTSNTWAENVHINVQMNSNNQVKVLVTNSDANPNETLRRQVNSNLFPRPPLEIEARLQQAGFAFNQTNSFAFNFTDIYTQETLVSTMYRKMVLTDFYSEIGLVVPTERCFGLGQRNGKFQLEQGTYSFNARARDESLPQDDGLGGKSGNHIHPFMLCQTQEKKDFFGIFFASTGPQVFEVVKYFNSTKMVINYITIGGAIEFYVFMRGSAKEIVSRYQNLVGMPMMPPYYALGVFHGSNVYNSWSKIRAVYDNYNGALTGAKQALEGVFVEEFNQAPHWSFTVNPTSYPNLASEVDRIHANNQRVIFGASLALAPDTNYPWYAAAKSAQCLVRSHASVAIGPLTGILDLVEVQYLDTFNKCYDSFIATTISKFNSDFAHGLDGLLVKDAHLPNHINGQLVAPGELKSRRMLLRDDPTPGPPLQALNEEMVGFYSPYKVNNDSSTKDLSTYYLPFIPAYKYSGTLDNMTVSLNATLGDDLGGGRYSSLLVRNGMAGYALKRTYNAVDQLKKNSSRSLLFSDSTWAGSGAYTTALLTDQYRDEASMQSVIGQTLALSMYGLSATMVDTCGSLGPMDEDLCARWTQLATFMPMVRNYYNSTYRDKKTGDRFSTQNSEPWTAKSDSLKLAYASLGDRLKLSRYIYTQMYLTHTQGGSLVRPLFFEYPHDEGSFSSEVQQSTFLLGDAVKVSPVLTKKNDGESFDSYFPQGVWVNLYNPALSVDAPAGGKNESLKVDSTQTNIHQRSGTFIPWLNNNKNCRTTKDVETQLRTSFRIVRDPVTNYAEGDFMIDDGITPNLYSPAYMDTYQHDVYDKNFTHYGLRYSSNKTINFMVQNGDAAYVPPSDRAYQYLEQIDILNAEDLAESDFACSLNRSWIPTNLTVYYTESTKSLTIKPIDGANLTFDQLMVIRFGNSQKDASFCHGFHYTAVIDDEGRAETYVRYNLTSDQAPGVIEDLVAEFTLLDNEGTILAEITTKSDYWGGKTKLYRPPQPEFYTLAHFGDKIPTRTLFEFLQVDTDNFAYRILNQVGDEIYHSDPNRLFITPFFVIDAGYFKANPATGKPIMGIGERAGRAMFKDEKDSVHTIWPYDAPNPIDDGKAPGKNMYGYQPVYYYQADTKDWVAVFDVSTYASDYFINTDFDGLGTAKVSKVAVGGMIQKIFLQSDGTIEDVIKKYQNITGYQTVPPMWAFGWNQCKFGYYNESIWWEVYENYTKFNIPLDTMWADIDYMDDYKVFTISQQTYPTLPEKVKKIKADGRFFVPIIDDAIAVRPGQDYEPYETGLNQSVFVLQAESNAPATGGVWPGHAYYPDFFKTETVHWWQDNLHAFNQKLPFDGIWLDMNEASSTCVGYCNPEERPQMAMKYDIPYIPGARDLEVQTLGLEARYTGVPTDDGKDFRREHDLRSLYAIKESQATYNYLAAGGERPFVLSRSNAPGIQKYAFHWLADNWSNQEWLSTSVDSLYEYNLFGLPLMGSDICGFNLEATPELCTRWHQLGAFYPFSRNHKNSVWKQTEPFQYNFTVPDLDDGRTYTDLIRTALLQRYSLIRYIYSNFHHIGIHGGAFFKPLYYEFQDDVTTFDADSTQRNILLGNALKLSIQTQNLDQVSTEYQFPKARWCQIMPTIDPTKCWDTSVDGADTVQRLDSGIADYQVHLRGGRIIPYQDAAGLGASKSADLMTAKTQLIVLANAENSPITIEPKTYTAQAAGTIYLDDGFSAKDTGRYDIEVISNGNGQYTIDFHTVTKLINQPGAGKAATVDSITFLWASKTGYKDIKKAQVFEITGGIPDLDAPVYDDKTDTLTVNLANQQAGKTWQFWGIDKIVISTAA